MATVKQRLNQVITTLDQEIRAVAQRKRKKNVVPKPHPPASADDIKRYEEHLQLALPPSYRAFLESNNGYDWLAYPGHMLSIQALMPGGTHYDKILDWKRTAAEYGLGDVIDAIVIANLGEPNNWAFIDPNQPTSGGEYAVVRWLTGDATNYPDLIGFFEGRIELCQMDLHPPVDEETDDEDDEGDDED